MRVLGLAVYRGAAPKALAIELIVRPAVNNLHGRVRGNADAHMVTWDKTVPQLL